VYLDHGSRELNLKLVYCGPGLSGKTTNLHAVRARTRPDCRGKLISLATGTERTLFFDFCPISLGTVGDLVVRLHLYTVPGQVFYGASRKLILRGVDGVCFVADSQATRMEANVESLDNMHHHLVEHGYDPLAVPIVLQYNKRDLPSALPRSVMSRMLNPTGFPEVGAVAVAGRGVITPLRRLTRDVLARLMRGPRMSPRDTTRAVARHPRRQACST
jgi:signal recognition particle receptor subunit beta